MGNDTLLEDLYLGRGSGPKSLQIEYDRDLTQDDLESLHNSRGTGGSVTPVLQRLRAPHHTLARLLADGVKGPELTLITGYSTSRICLLQQDPAFKELVAYYREQVTARYLDVHSRLATLGTTAVEILQEKLDETPVSELGFKTVKEVAEFALDRSIAPAKGGPRSSPGGSGVSINVQFGGPDNSAQPSTTIDVTPTRVEERK